MKGSLFLAITGAALAVAGPLSVLEKRAMHTDWVTEVVTVVVTAGSEPTQPPPPPPAPTAIEKPVQQKQKAPAEESKPEPKPEPVYTQVQPKPDPKPTESNSAPSKGPGDSYESTMLYHHNVHRANHSAPDLEWDNGLASSAKQLASTCVFEHDTDIGGGGYGQNLAMWGSSGDVADVKMNSAAGAVTNQWYNGEFDAFTQYGAASPDMANFHVWGHFTQILWKSTTKVGCATVSCAAGTISSMDSWYTVCNYDPAGNFAGQYGANVMKPKSAEVVTV